MLIQYLFLQLSNDGDSASAVNLQITSNELDDLHSDILTGGESNCILSANFRRLGCCEWKFVNL